jgi:hypothetical protein
MWTECPPTATCVEGYAGLAGWLKGSLRSLHWFIRVPVETETFQGFDTLLQQF